VAKCINASVVQGSALGLVAYIINVADMRAITPSNKLRKYADDTYLVVPSRNKDPVTAELDHFEQWAKENNLRLNKTKSSEMIVRKSNKMSTFVPPPPIPDVVRVTSLNILGVTIDQTFSMREHIDNLVTSTGQNLYALKVLKAHGLKPLR